MKKSILISGLVILIITSFVSCKKFLKEKQVAAVDPGLL
jgi:hypothetical protein